MKKLNKDREPIALRSKPLKDGRASLYLDYYEPERGRNHAHRYEFLKLYLLPDRRDTKEANRATLEAAKAIQARRLLDRANGKAGIATAKTNLMLSDYFDIVLKRKKAAGLSEKRLIVYNNVRDRVKEHCDTPLTNVSPNYLRDVITTLVESDDTRATRNPRTIKASTANLYYSLIIAVINQARREGLITSNPKGGLSSDDKRPIKAKQAQRDFLTADELQKLNDTPTGGKQTKAAFMFACFTGLRWSDIKKLRWDDIKTDGEKKFVRVVMTKTKREVIVPLSQTAQSFLPKQRGALVFDRLTGNVSTINATLKAWAKRAGINKNMCFHVSRHTFATSLLTQGADIYTTSKLLGHTDLKTTQIYAEIVNKKREEAVNLLDNIKLK